MCVGTSALKVLLTGATVVPRDSKVNVLPTTLTSAPYEIVVPIVDHDDAREVEISAILYVH